MWLYRENGERFKCPRRKVISRRTQGGKIYQIDKDKAIKIFKASGRDEPNEDVLRAIQQMDLPHIYKLYDFLYNRKGDFKALTMKLYESSNPDLLTSPSSYVIRNMMGVVDTLDSLGKQNILAQDLHQENIILGPEDWTLIDADYYNFDLVGLGIPPVTTNRYLFKNLLTDLIEKSFIDYNRPFSLEHMLMIKKLFDGGFEQACERLGNYGSLAEYFDSYEDFICKF